MMPPHPDPLCTNGAREYWRKIPRREGARGRKILVPSPLMGEGEDEGEKPKIRHAMACRYIKRRTGTIHCAPPFFNSFVGV